jgi:hypothetical protein
MNFYVSRAEIPRKMDLDSSVASLPQNDRLIKEVN